MLNVLDVKHEKIKGDDIYTVILDDGKSYAWDVYFISHCGWMLRALFNVEGVKLPRVMIEKVNGEEKYIWWDDEGEPRIRELSEGERLAYCRVSAIFHIQ